MKESQPLIMIGDLIDTVRAVLPSILHCNLCTMFSNQVVDHFLEKRDYATLRQIAGADDPGWLDKSLRGGIEFEYRESHWLESSLACVLQMLIECFRKFVKTRAITFGAEEEIRCLCRECNRPQCVQAGIGDGGRRQAFILVS